MGGSDNFALWDLYRCMGDLSGMLFNGLLINFIDCELWPHLRWSLHISVTHTMSMLTTTHKCHAHHDVYVDQYTQASPHTPHGTIHHDHVVVVIIIIACGCKHGCCHAYKILHLSWHHCGHHGHHHCLLFKACLQLQYEEQRKFGSYQHNSTPLVQSMHHRWKRGISTDGECVCVVIKQCRCVYEAVGDVCDGQWGVVCVGINEAASVVSVGVCIKNGAVSDACTSSWIWAWTIRCGACAHIGTIVAGIKTAVGAGTDVDASVLLALVVVWPQQLVWWLQAFCKEEGADWYIKIILIYSQEE